MRARVFIWGCTWLTSLAVHGAIAGGLGWLAFRSMQPSALPVQPTTVLDRTIAVELPPFAEGTLLADRDRAPEPSVEPLPRPRGATVPRVDSKSLGRGGEATVDNPAVNLSDVDERMRLSAALLSRLDRDQVQRLRSSQDRASREDRRSTLHPTELVFLASGVGDRMERRPPSAVDPSRGTLLTDAAAVVGGDLGTPDPLGDDGARTAIGGKRLGTTVVSPPLGIRDGNLGKDHRASAAVTTARPDVRQGAVAVEALHRGRPNDNVDSDQEVATTVSSLVHASTAGGLAGRGVGGSLGGGDPGAGRQLGEGSHPVPLGDGDGGWLDLETTDPRLVPYFRKVHAKVNPLWADAFPKSAMLELKQGTVILEFTILPDGTARVNWPPLRPSGIEEFDRNCANAIRRASPFDPVPKDLGRASLHIRAPFVAVNPIVR